MSSESIQHIFRQSIKALISALEAKDPYTNGHSVRVSEYSVILARNAGWDPELLEIVRYAALMHDIGKIGVPDSVLNRGSHLTNTEFELLKTHTLIGSEITSNITSFPDACDAARSHHERYDGKGYPDGLKGKDIPDIARLIAIADTFDAMNSDRIYRNALPREVILEELENGCGTQFDPDYLKIFINLYKEGALDIKDFPGCKNSESSPEIDDFSHLARDFFDFFSLKFEFTGLWDEEYKNPDKIKSFIEHITSRHNSQYLLCIISIFPEPETTVSSGQMLEAMEAMLKALKNTCSPENNYTQISRKEVAVLYRKNDKYSIDDMIKNSLSYFYKIFRASDFDVTYQILN